MFQKILSTSLLIIIFSFSIFPQQYKRPSSNMMSNNILLTLEGGSTYPNTDYSSKSIDYMGRISLEYFLPTYTNSILGFKLFAEGGYISAEDNNRVPDQFRTEFSTIGAGVQYIFNIKNVFFPYILAGGGFFKFSPKDEFGNLLPDAVRGGYKQNEFNYLLEGGFKIPVTENLTVNLSGGLHLSTNDNLDDVKGNGNDDVMFKGLFGLSYAFFSNVDSDKDGVEDDDDKCPNTPKGVPVDDYGCILDIDKDGVSDDKDKCANTPFGVKVDYNGCPLDSDNDKVPDHIDICPSTPLGVSVDELGCPFDIDADGVYDYQDKCLNTPLNVEVDRNGCPIDKDKDGVPDYLDKCPDTELGKKVDNAGCEVIEKKPEIKKDSIEVVNKIETPVSNKPSLPVNLRKEVVVPGNLFAFNSPVLSANIQKILDQFVNRIKPYKESVWRIESYTDNVGSDEGNIKMSTLRAEAIRDYLVSKGIDSKNLIAVGMGKKNPISENKTEAGRTKNRRAVIKFVK